MRYFIRFFVLIVMFFVAPGVTSASYSTFIANKDIIIYGVIGQDVQADLVIFEGTMTESWTSSGGKLNVVVRSGSKFITGTGNQYVKSIVFRGPVEYCGENSVPGVTKIIFDVNAANEGVYNIYPSNVACSSGANILNVVEEVVVEEEVAEEEVVVEEEVVSVNEDEVMVVVEEAVGEDEVMVVVKGELAVAKENVVVEELVVAKEEIMVVAEEVPAVAEEVVMKVEPVVAKSKLEVKEVVVDEELVDGSSVFDTVPASELARANGGSNKGVSSNSQSSGARNEIGMMLSEGIYAETDIFVKKVMQESTDIFTKNAQDLDEIIRKNGLVVNVEAEKRKMDKYAYPLVADQVGLGIKDIYTINNFIVYGTDSTSEFGRGERASLVHSFKRAYGKVPVSQFDWENVIRIANGAWVSKTNNRAERIARNEFIKIYKRKPDMLNSSDKAAIIIMAYGLRPQGRDLISELKAANVFRMVFNKNPNDGYDWDLIRGIAYSGATTDAYLLKSPLETGEKVPVKPRPEGVVVMDADEINRINSESVGLCKSYYQFTSFLKTGVVSAEVRALQEILQCLGYFPATLKSTAIYGEVTMQAVKAFQRARGLDVYGFVGPKTRALLNDI